MKIPCMKTARAILLAAALSGVATLAAQEAIFKWPQHDRNRPAPKVITPGECSTQEHTGNPPSDAVVLFNGKDLSNWKSLEGGPARWTVENGYFQVAPGTGDIETR